MANTGAYESPVKILASGSSFPSVGFHGMVGFKQADNTFWFWNGSAWVPLGAGAGGSSIRRNSIWNPRISPSAYDDEFESSTLDAKWTRSVSGTTVTNGTVDLFGSVTPDCIQDLHGTWPSWLLLQSDESDAQIVEYSQPWTATDDATFMILITLILEDTAAAANARRSIYISLENSADSNEWARAGFHISTTTRVILGQVNNDGTLSSDISLDPGEFSTGGTEGVILWKDSDVYRVGRISDLLGCKYSAATLTKTGVTTFDRLKIVFKTDPNTPSTIMGVDAIRVYDSITIGLKNP